MHVNRSEWKLKGFLPSGESPRKTRAAWCYLAGMKMLLLIVLLILLLGGGGFYFGDSVIGGIGLGIVLLICLVAYLTGGFRPAKR